MEVKKNSTVDNIIHACMLQLSLKAELKRFGKKAEGASQKQIQQIHDMYILNNILYKEL